MLLYEPRRSPAGLVELLKRTLDPLQLYLQICLTLFGHARNVADTAKLGQKLLSSSTQLDKLGKINHATLSLTSNHWLPPRNARSPPFVSDPTGTRHHFTCPRGTQ